MTSRLIKADTERACMSASEQAHQVVFLQVQQPTTETQATPCALLLMDRHRDTVAAQLLQVTNSSIASHVTVRGTSSRDHSGPGPFQVSGTALVEDYPTNPLWLFVTVLSSSSERSCEAWS